MGKNSVGTVQTEALRRLLGQKRPKYGQVLPLLLELKGAGLSVPAIARRLNKSAGYINRCLKLPAVLPLTGNDGAAHAALSLEEALYVADTLKAQTKGAPTEARQRLKAKLLDQVAAERRLIEGSRITEPAPFWTDPAA